nr:MAG TPA: hypothetical protein [Caudoviricetes sp.]
MGEPLPETNGEALRFNACFRLRFPRSTAHHPKVT